jgi:hypothetical protein
MTESGTQLAIIILGSAVLIGAIALSIAGYAINKLQQENERLRSVIKNKGYVLRTYEIDELDSKSL